MKKALIVLMLAISASFAAAAPYGLLTANGDSTELSIKGPFFFRASGTWGSGTMTIYYKSRDGAWKNLGTTTAMTSDISAQNLYDMPPGTVTRVRATLSGATSPSLAWEFIGDVVGE